MNFELTISLKNSKSEVVYFKQEQSNNIVQLASQMIMALAILQRQMLNEAEKELKGVEDDDIPF